jgi:UPF0271 protein
LSRRVAGSLMTDPQIAAERALRVIGDGCVEAVDGTLLSMTVHTACVQSLQPGSGDMARAIREILERNGVQLTAMSRLV